MAHAKRVLITGGAGFLGTSLCELLLEAGHTVICLDNFQTGCKENVQHLLVRPQFELIRHDITQPVWLEVDWIFNLACPASPVHYQQNPIKTIKTSVIGTLNLLGLAKRVGARIFQASTSEVYGDPEQHPQTESYWGHVNPIGTRACYDEGKRCAEALCMDYHRRHGLDTRIVRIFNCYGPRMALDDGRVVSNFIAQALTGQPLTIYGDGQQTRSFCYVDDMIAGFLRLMQYEGDDCHEPHNIGNPAEFTIKQLAQIVQEAVGQQVVLAHRPLPADDPKQRRPNIERARRNLLWEPKISLHDGVTRTAAAFRRRLGKAA